MGERLSTETLAADPLVFVSEPQNSISPHRTLVHSALLGMMQMRFLCLPWGFKKASGSLAHSSIFLLLRISTDSHSQMLCGHLFSALVLGESSCTSVGTFTAEMSLQILSCSPWEQGQPFLCCLPSYLSPCGLFYKSLVIGLLFS